MSYAIFCDPNYYAGTINAALPGVLRDHDYQVIALTSKEDADALCEMLGDNNASYTLSHGQYAPPSYTPSESTAASRTLEDAMLALHLNYDFRSDGTRIDVY